MVRISGVSQFVTWNGFRPGELAPSALPIVPLISVWLQLVGLNVNPGRLIATYHVLDLQRDAVDDRRDRVRSAGGLVVIVSAAVCGSTSIFARTTTGLPSWRSNGPAFAGLTIERPNGAPWYGPVM